MIGAAHGSSVYNAVRRRRHLSGPMQHRPHHTNPMVFRVDLRVRCYHRSFRRWTLAISFGVGIENRGGELGGIGVRSFFRQWPLAGRMI